MINMCDAFNVQFGHRAGTASGSERSMVSGPVAPRPLPLAVLTFEMFRWVPGFLIVLTLALFSEGCSKQPVASERADKNTNAANANQQDQSAAMAPHLEPTLRGDIERASLAISMARDSVRLNKWQDAVSQLQGARKEIEAALTRQPVLRDELEGLKAAFDRAIPAVEGREKEAEARIAELQTRVGAIKVNSGL